MCGCEVQKAIQIVTLSIHVMPGIITCQSWGYVHISMQLKFLHFVFTVSKFRSDVDIKQRTYINLHMHEHDTNRVIHLQQEDTQACLQTQ